MHKRKFPVNSLKGPSFDGPFLLVLFIQMVNRQQRDDAGGLISISLVLRVVAIASHLALFPSLSAVEHDKHNENISNDHRDPR